MLVSDVCKNETKESGIRVRMVANDRNQLKEIVDQKIIVMRIVNALRRIPVCAFIC